MTSVKDVRVTEPATADGLGRGSFAFTDAYSVFDWGRMPDRIPDKGASLCTMGAVTFESLETAGVGTHYRGIVVDGATRPLSAALDDGVAPTEMAIDVGRVPDLPESEGDYAYDYAYDYDYDAYHAAAGAHYVVPLEIVFRNQVGEGSSLRERTEPTDHGLSFDRWPAEPVELDEPIVEFSTKYEAQDRYLDRTTADRIAGQAAIDDLEDVAREVNELITTRAERAGLTHQDGKIECLYADGDVLVADVVGTFDENRFACDGQQVSKEVLRQYHKRAQPAWVEAVRAAKRRATETGRPNWRDRCERTPAPLPTSVVEAVRDLYCAGTNAYVRRRAFEAPDLAAAVGAVRSL